MARSFDHMQPRGAPRGYYPPHTRACSRRCDYCIPRLRWSRSRERAAVQREIERDLAVPSNAEIAREMDDEVQQWCCYP
jgi:hypothetical protein